MKMICIRYNPLDEKTLKPIPHPVVGEEVTITKWIDTNYFYLKEYQFKKKKFVYNKKDFANKNCKEQLAFILEKEKPIDILIK